jgi:hypothetical protein
VTLCPICEEAVGVMNIAVNARAPTEYRSDDIVTWMVKAVSSPCRAVPSRAEPGRATYAATQRCGKHLSAALPW